jgi:hypothetical protein
MLGIRNAQEENEKYLEIRVKKSDRPRSVSSFGFEGLKEATQREL